jgi:hypothetical protein
MASIDIGYRRRVKEVENHTAKYNTVLWIDGQDEETVERCVDELQLSVN